MSYRVFVIAGVAVGLTAATALAQMPRQQQSRPGSSAQQVKQLLEDLEGSWDVEIKAWTLADAKREMQQQGTDQPSRPGQSTGQVDTQQIEQQIQQAMTQAGVEQEQARTHSQRLARMFAQQKPSQQSIQQQLQSAMTQAGVDMQEARQQAERLSRQIHQQIQQSSSQDQPGIRPERDESTSPFTRPGQERSRSTDEYGEPTLRAEGSSNRNWVLDDNILEEECDFSIATEAPADRPNPSATGFQRGLDKAVEMLRDGETLQGHGMFGFDENTGHVFHVWADSSQSKIFYSVGEFNQRERTVTFYTADAKEILNGMSSPQQPGMRPSQPRPNQPQPLERPGDDGALMSLQQSTQPSWQRPSSQSDESKARVVLKILSNNEHVIEYYRPDESSSSPSTQSQALRTMVVTYKRSNSN